MLQYNLYIMWNPLTLDPLIIYIYLIRIKLPWTTIIVCHKTTKSENFVLKIIKSEH